MLQCPRKCALISINNVNTPPEIGWQSLKKVHFKINIITYKPKWGTWQTTQTDKCLKELNKRGN